MLLDTSAWIEYFEASEKGNEISALMLSGYTLYSCPLTIAEISSWCHRNNKEPLTFLKKINELSIIVELNEDILLRSGKIHFELRNSKTEKIESKISLIDCIIYETAHVHGLELLTKDNDFEGLPGVKML
ncbi:MAG: PIN domain-containing protein [Candidatus Micrarchaeota archaeon]|nr:PIN domain-containing protein [Candidatus Micrarchaeota archaeon]